MAEAPSGVKQVDSLWVSSYVIIYTTLAVGVKKNVDASLALYLLSPFTTLIPHSSCLPAITPSFDKFQIANSNLMPPTAA
jgi:hypothetical protein